MPARICCFAAFAVLCAVWMSPFSQLSLWAQENTTEAPATEENPAKVEQFDALFADWMDKLDQLGKLRDEFQNADNDRKLKIREEFRAIIASGEELLPRLATAAEKKFSAAPDPNSEEAKFLLEVVQDLHQRDSVERVSQLSEALIKGSVDDDKLYEKAALAAFHSANYDLAEERFKQADEREALSEPAKESRKLLAYYRDAWKEELEFRKKEAEADDLPRVKLSTSKGDVVVELFENEAPNTVANFVSLVEKGFYDGIKFHRVIPQFMAQGGCPNGDGSGGPGYTIKCECLGDVHRKHFRGSLSMAKKNPPHTGGSQFFLNFVPTKHLDGKHTVFGRVIEGMDVMSKLQRDPGRAGPADKIVKAEVVRKREHEYKPETMPE